MTWHAKNGEKQNMISLRVMPAKPAELNPRPSPRSRLPFPRFVPPPLAVWKKPWSLSVLGAAMKLFEINGTTLTLALFADVTNSRELLDSMQAGTLEPEVAFLNASLIPDVFPVLAAAYKTLVSKSRDSLTTRTLHSELVYNYSGSKHITESLKRCGISDSSSYVLAARFNASPNEMKAIEKLVHGKEINLEELGERADQAQIQKHFKITEPELTISSVGDAITCRIAARDAL